MTLKQQLTVHLWWDGYTERTKRTGGGGLQQVVSDHAAGAAGGVFVLSPVGVRRRMKQTGCTHRPRAPRLCCSAHALVSLPPRPRALCSERNTTDTVIVTVDSTDRPHARAVRLPRAGDRSTQVCHVVTVTPEGATAVVTLELRTLRLSRGRLSEVPLRCW